MGKGVQPKNDLNSPVGLRFSVETGTRLDLQTFSAMVGELREGGQGKSFTRGLIPQSEAHVPHHFKNIFFV